MASPRRGQGAGGQHRGRRQVIGRAQAFAWPDIAVGPCRRHSEERRRPGGLRQGDRYRGQARSTPRGSGTTSPRGIPWPPTRRRVRPLRGEGKQRTGRCPSVEPTPMGPAEAGPEARLMGRTRRKSRETKPPLLHLRYAPLLRLRFPRKSEVAWVERLPVRHEAPRTFRGRFAGTGGSSRKCLPGPPPRCSARLPRKACQSERRQHLGRSRRRCSARSLPKEQPGKQGRGLGPRARRPTTRTPEGGRVEAARARAGASPGHRSRPGFRGNRALDDRQDQAGRQGQLRR